MLEELPDYAKQLRNMKPSWARWGTFRANALDILTEHCNEATR